MKILSADEMRNVEKLAFQRYFTERELMGKAGYECAKVIMENFDLSDKNVTVLCGNGKNGGDGFVIAKQLHNICKSVEIVIADKLPEISDPLYYFNEAIDSGVQYKFYEKNIFDNTDLIVDCVFGIGFHGQPNELFSNIFSSVNLSNAFVVSVDVPSGTNSSNGDVAGSCIKADMTLAISNYKYSHILPPSNGYCGKIIVVNIGIYEDCYVNTKNILAINCSYVSKLLKPRDFNCNKGNFGKLLCICGSYNMPGACVICANSALSTGAGLVKCAFPVSAYSAITSNVVEATFLPVNQNINGRISAKSVEALISEISCSTSVLLGCGLGLDDDVQNVVEHIIKNADCPLIIDADGINAVSHNIDILREAKNSVILTPHPGEMARLLNCDVKFVQQNRLKVTKDFAEKYGVTVVLKGANTVISDGEKTFVNFTGNASMAKGGSGDMLAGMIASFVAQGFDSVDSSVAGVYLHGLAGDLCLKENSEFSVTATKMINYISGAFSQLER